jgi:hypothetical protein
MITFGRHHFSPSTEAKFNLLAEIKPPRHEAEAV